MEHCNCFNVNIDDEDEIVAWTDENGICRICNKPQALLRPDDAQLPRNEITSRIISEFGQWGRRYVEEAEHQDGILCWTEFDSMADIRKDVALYIKESLG